MKDVSPLAKLRYLRNVNLSNTAVVNVNPLMDSVWPQRLQDLDLSFNRQLKQIRGLANLGSLENVNLSYTGIESIEGLRRVGSLTTLNVSNNPNLTNLNPLIQLDIFTLLPAYIRVRQTLDLRGSGVNKDTIPGGHHNRNLKILA